MEPGELENPNNASVIQREPKNLGSADTKERTGVVRFDAEGRSVASPDHPQENQDAFFLLRETGAAGVFDGVGGEEGGTYASRAARDAAGTYIMGEMQKNPRGLTREQAVKLAYEAMMRANRAVLREQQEERVRRIDGKEVKVRYPEMSTTGCIVVPYQEQIEVDGVVTTKHGVVVVNVGDSRAYLLRNGQQEQTTFRQITLDDGFPRGYVPNEEEARKIQEELNNATDREGLSDKLKFYYDNRNVITQALGDRIVTPRVTIVEGLEPGDRVLVCTDGIHDNLTDREINLILNSTDYPNLVVQKLLEAAQQRANSSHPRAKPDDMTAVVMIVRGEPPSVEPSSPALNFTELPPESLAKFFNIEVGSTVWVRRSPVDVNKKGPVDKGWTVERIYSEGGTGYADVTKRLPDGTILSKERVRLTELLELNTPTTVEDISRAENPPDLLRIVSLLSGEYLSPGERDKTVQIIIEVFANRRNIEEVPNIGKLPEVVEKLLRRRNSKRNYQPLQPVVEEQPGQTLEQGLRGVPRISSIAEIQIGSNVAVIRSSGIVDTEPWTVTNIDPKAGTATVTRRDGDKVLLKKISLGELYQWNRPTTETDIRNADNLSQLAWVIMRLKNGGLWGSDQHFYPSNELIIRINAVFAGKAPLNTVTRTGNLREKVTNLLINEILAGRVPEVILGVIYNINPELEEKVKRVLRERNLVRRK